MSIEAMKQALEALELHAEQYPHMQKGYTVDAITSLRAAIEEAEKQEPIGEVVVESMGVRGSDAMQVRIHFHEVPPVGTKIYSAPPRPEWVGLTDADIEQGHKESWVDKQAFESAVWWAEAKLKEKNT